MYIKKIDKTKIPKHLAIILDGNGRWAKKRGLPRTFGHYQGGLNIAKTAQICDELGIKVLTVYAFSTENWKRPKEEVDYLMTTPIKEFSKYKDKIYNSNIRITHVGRRTELPEDLLGLMDEITKHTKDHQGLLLQIAFNYGSYDEITKAYEHLFELGKSSVTEKDIWDNLYVKQPVDLLIRTSGEKRLSNFLLWQAAYAELYFTKTHWPAFNKRSLYKAIKHYQKRDRRFGGLKK